MYAILGATGQVGGAVLDTLLAQEPAEWIRAVGRRRPARLPREAEWRHADLRGDTAALADALAGATAAFVLSPLSPGAPDVHAEGEALARTLAEAVVRSGCPRVVALSSQGAHLARGTGVIGTLHALEAALRRTGARTTFLRSTFFMQSWLPFAQAAMASGTWHAMHVPLDAPLDAVSARDVGACAARLMREPDPPAIVNIGGAGAWSERDVAGIVAGLAGRPIEVVAVPPERRADVLCAAGLGRSHAQALAEMHAAIEAGAVPFEPVPRTEHGTESLEEVVARSFAG